MIKEAIEIGLGFAAYSIDFFAKRHKEFKKRGKKIEQKNSRLKKFTDNLDDYESRVLNYVKHRLPFASKEEVADLAKKINRNLKRKK